MYGRLFEIGYVLFACLLCDCVAQKSQTELPSDVDLDVFLVNGHKVSVNIRCTDRTDDVLEVRTRSVSYKF